jgi:hypothetical protein
MTVLPPQIQDAEIFRAERFGVKSKRLARSYSLGGACDEARKPDPLDLLEAKAELARRYSLSFFSGSNGAPPILSHSS